MAWRSRIDDLRAHLLASLGVVSPLLLAACGGAPTNDAAGVTTDPSGDGASVDDGAEGTTASGSPTTSTSTGPSPETESSSDDDAEAGDGDGPKLDLPSKPDLPPPPAACTVQQVPESTLEEHPDCPIMLGVCWDLYWGCVELEEGQSCARLCPDGDCVREWWTCDGDPIFDLPNSVCGPYEVDGMCCSLADISNLCGTDGRPFVVEGVARQATLRVRDQPSRPGDRADHGSLALEALPERVRERLAAHWAAIARAEHASIASFAQFGARLLALGAPPRLVHEALAAAGDEVRHAELALARASELGARGAIHRGSSRRDFRRGREAETPLYRAYCQFRRQSPRRKDQARGREGLHHGLLGEVALEFGPLDTRGAARADERLVDTVLACVREGCIGETLAALEVGAAALACEDRALAAELQAVAQDEARHAALAWRFVAWALDHAPDLAPAVAAVFDSLGELIDSHARQGGLIPEAEPERFDPHELELLHAHGWLPAEELGRIRHDALHELLRPCAAALLGRHGLCDIMASEVS